MEHLEASLRRARILIVEDNRINAEMLRAHLQHAGFEHLSIADNGREALIMSESLTPDLVVLDLIMPHLDGFGYCEAVRKLPALAHVPIIVQTGLESQEDKLRAFSIGASDYITKPIHGPELIARVRVHLLQKLLREEVIAREAKLLEELDAAQRMQQRLLPSETELASLRQHYPLDIAAYFEPCSTLGGDFWTVRPLSEQRLALSIFDFSGHGVAAALNVFRMHTLMHELTLEASDPGRFLTLLNHAVQPLLARHEFATMLYGVIDLEAGRFEYASAASTPAFIQQHGTNTPLWLDIRGVPLGVLPNANYENLSAPLAPGDALVLFSDCLIETPNPEGVSMSPEMIASHSHRILQERHDHPAQAICAGLLQAFRAEGRNSLSDDMTLNVYVRQ